MATEPPARPPAPAMRLDRFLWWARLAKTRSAAQALAEAGTMRIAGRRIDRAAAMVRVGDTLTFMSAGMGAGMGVGMGAGGTVRVVRILCLPTRRGPPAEGRGCYTELSGGAELSGGVVSGHENDSQPPRDD